MLEYFCSHLTVTQFLIMALCALLIGFNKTGMPGIGVLPVVILTMIFPAKLSTGIQLLMLCSADAMALGFYRKRANWGVVFKVIPFAILGLTVGSFILAEYADSDAKLRVVIGIIILFISLLNVVRKYLLKDGVIPPYWWVGAIAGITVGITTQLANAAGPVIAIYLLALNLDKSEYMGTCVWIFMLINWIKLPIFITEGRISLDSLYIIMPMLPMLLAGAFLGFWTVKKLPTQVFENIIQIIVFISALKLIIF